MKRRSLPPAEPAAASKKRARPVFRETARRTDLTTEAVPEAGEENAAAENTAAAAVSAGLAANSAPLMGAVDLSFVVEDTPEEALPGSPDSVDSASIYSNSEEEVEVLDQRTLRTTTPDGRGAYSDDWSIESAVAVGSFSASSGGAGNSVSEIHADSAGSRNNLQSTVDQDCLLSTASASDIITSQSTPADESLIEFRGVKTASAGRLVRYLRRINESAYSLLSLLRMLAQANMESQSEHVHEPVPDFSSGLPTELREQLQLYVVTPLRGSVDLQNIPKSHRALANSGSSLSDEEFLMKLWATKNTKAEPTLFNREIYTGPWLQLLLCKLATRNTLTFVLLHCDVFRYCARTGSWLCYGRSYDLQPYYRADRSGRRLVKAQQDSKWESVTKQDIMYRQRGKNDQNALNAYDEILKLDVDLDNQLKQRMANTVRHLRRYTKLALSDRVRLPARRHGPRFDSPPADVARFVAREVSSLIPRSLLGSKHNFSQFEVQLTEFLPYRGKVDTRQLLKGLRPTEIPWLKQKWRSDSNAARQQLRICIGFLYNVVVKHVLQLHFYITEMSGMPAHQLFYYSHSVWISRMQRQATAEFLEANTEAQPLLASKVPSIPLASSKKSSTTPTMTSTSSLNPLAMENTSPLNWRLVPKPDGSLRPIINLRPLNASLEVPHLILSRRLADSGSRTRVTSWHAWAIHLWDFYQQHSNMNERDGSGFYVVKADIAACYDNADRDAVTRAVSKLLENGNQMYCVSRRARLDVKQLRLKVIKTARPIACSSESSTGAKTASTTNNACRSRRLVLEFERPKHEMYDAHSVLETVSSLFERTYLRTGPSEMVRFTAGIPQGSACSLDLCDALLDDLVEQELSDLASDSGSMLLRYVDDFLFVSKRRDLAQQFAKRMAAGFPTYGVRCNPAKIVDTSVTGSPVPKCIQFLGIGIEPKTLRIVPTQLERVDENLVARGDCATVRRRLAGDMNQLVGVLQTFKRARKFPPKYLEARVAHNVGAAMIFRTKAVMKAYEKDSTISALHCVINQYLLPSVQRRDREFVKTVALRAFRRAHTEERKAKNKNRKAG